MRFLFGFRKLSITLLCIILLTIFLLTGHISGTAYASGISGMVIAYNSANVGEHLMNLGKQYLNKLKEDKE